MIAKIRQSPEQLPLYRLVHVGITMDYSSAAPRRTLYYTTDLKEALYMFEELIKHYSTGEHGTVCLEQGLTNQVDPKFMPIRFLQWKYANSKWEQEIVFAK